MASKRSKMSSQSSKNDFKRVEKVLILVSNVQKMVQRTVQNLLEHPVVTKKDVIEVVQEENNSVNSAATVISARTARKRRIAGIFQHYYPEGGWGYVVLLSAFLSQILAQGLQLGMLVLMPYASRRFHASSAEIGKNNFC